MSGIRQRLIGLCLVPALFCALDATLTLLGQSTEYWGGAYSGVNETSPTFHGLLQIQPSAFAVGIVVWAAVFVGIILLLSDTLALVVSIAVTFGHTAGAATWLLFHFRFGYQACNGLFLLSALLLGLAIRWGWQASPRHAYRVPFMSGAWRWVVASLLFAIGVYLFLWPRST